MLILGTYNLSNYSIVFLVSITAFIFYLKWVYNYWERRGVKSAKPSIPFGNAGDIFLQKNTMGVSIRDIYQEFKPQGLRYCGFYFLWKPILMILDPELIRLIMTKDFQNFTDHGNYVNEEVDPLSGHLFSLKGTKWKNLRVKLTPTFTSGKMKMMFQTLLNCSDELVVLMNSLVENKQNIDIKDVVARFSTDVIGSCAFGIECNSLKDPQSEFRKYGRKVFELDFVESMRNFVAFVYPDMLNMFRLPLTKKDVTKFFMGIVNETVKFRETNNVTRKDFMELLIRIKNNVNLNDEEIDKNNNSNGTTKGGVGNTLSMPELAAQAYVFFLAGFETSSTTLTFCFYELVNKLEVQEKLRKEINDTLLKYDGKITYDGIMEMTYMDKCINEALRKYPPVPFLQRECNKTYKIPDSDLVIEKGTQLFIPIYAIQRDIEYYPDPENFDPERFTPEMKAKRHAFTWLPFGEGPRACIGLRFGMMQTKIALTILLKNYYFTLNPNTKTPLKMDPKSFVLAADGKIWLNAEKIEA